MRADVAARYRDLTRNPQPIIYSTIPPEERTDFLPPRVETRVTGNAKVEDNDDFKLGSGVNVAPSADFELAGSAAAGAQPVAAPKAEVKPTPEKPATDGPDKPQSTTQVTAASPTSDSKKSASETTEPPAPETSPGEETKSASRKSANNKTTGDDDLFSIAVEEQKEVKKRRGKKNAERQRKQVLVPCSCGAWIRVNEDQAGKSVRCKQCKQPVVVPGLRRKSDKEKSEKRAEKEKIAQQARLEVTWLDDVSFHILAPATLVLKPGSLTGKHTAVDLAITPSGLHLLSYTGGTQKKRSLFSFVGSSKKVDHQLRRKQIREQVETSGEFKNLENVELRSVEADKTSDIRLVQPVAKVSESMFAGVPVFGEGRIAIFLPIPFDDGKQAFLSFPLSVWRVVGEKLKSLFSIDLGASENGIPESESVETLSCFLNQSKVEAVRGQIYYQTDTAFKLELTGYKCKACGTAVSEEGRKKAKLGGVKGKSIAKAKCPKCSAKMQAESLYKVVTPPAAS
jgi:DNA-directed RNA polymerase subunit RPC12/RpoP